MARSHDQATIPEVEKQTPIGLDKPQIPTLKGHIYKKGSVWGPFFQSIDGSRDHTGEGGYEDEILPSRLMGHSPDAQMGQAGHAVGGNVLGMVYSKE